MQLRKLTASLLAFLFLFCSLPFFAAAEEAEENEIYQIWSRDRDITPDIHITESVFNNGSPQSEHYICFTPGRTARPFLAYGDTIREKLEFPAAAELVEDRILAGINGDYFVMATGMPLGIVLHEGELISSDAGNTAFGFYEDGSAILGLPGLSMELSAEGARCAVGGINKNHKSGQFSLYTAAWGETVPLNEDYYCLELIPEDGKKLTIGGEIPCVCGRVNKPDGALPLEEGKLLLCYSGPEETWQASGLEQVEPGATLTLQIQASDERFSDCTEALGCLYPLLADGSILPGLDDIDKNKAPRTAIGIREDGTVILYTADGRQSGYAIGLKDASSSGGTVRFGGPGSDMDNNNTYLGGSGNYKGSGGVKASAAGRYGFEQTQGMLAYNFFHGDSNHFGIVHYLHNCDRSGSNGNYSTADVYSEQYWTGYPDLYRNGSDRLVYASTWFIPSADEWKLMTGGFGVAQLNKMLTKGGFPNIRTNSYYWTPRQKSAGSYYLVRGDGGDATSYGTSTQYAGYLRPFIAF